MSEHEIGGQLKDPLIGQTFAGRYRIERRLGQGGMGVVYAARQLTMDRVVALKVLSSELGASEAARARFVREMRATSRVEHANTVRVYDFGEDDAGHLFLTMELLDGRNLQSELHQRGALDTGRVLRIGEAIARALAAAHAEGIVHRDLKPENVMLVDRYGERDVVKVLDFGIARILDGDSSDAVTRTGSLIGTPLYMSPEAAIGKKVDHRADLYALGVVLFQMVAGRVPFSDAMPVRVLFMHANDPVPPLETIAPGRASPALAALITSLLAKNPDERPQDAAVVAQQLRAFSDAPTLAGVDPMLDSRLAEDPDAKAHALALHRDPARAVGTLREDETPTSAPGDHGPVDVTAATMADVVAPIMTAVDSAVTAETIADVTSPLHAATIGPENAPIAEAGDAEQAVAEATEAPTGSDSVDDTITPIDAASTSPSPPGGGGRGVWWAVGALVVAGIVGTVIWVSGRTPAPPPATAAPDASQPTSQPTPAENPPEGPELAAAAATAGLPRPPDACRPTDAAERAALLAAYRALEGAGPQRKAAGDKAAVAGLSAATSGEALAVSAWALLAAGEGHVAVANRADAALRACAESALAHRTLGIVHLQGQRWERAQASLQKARKLAPDDAASAYRLGVAELGLRAPAAAREAFEAAIALDPKQIDAHVGRGRAALAAAALDDARSAFTEAIRLAPDRGDAHFFLGATLAQAGEADAAKASFCTAAKAGYAPARARCPDLGSKAPPLH